MVEVNYIKEIQNYIIFRMQTMQVTGYWVAKEAGIPHSSFHNLMTKDNFTIAQLMKVLKAVDAKIFMN